MALDLERLVRYPTNSETWLTTLLVGSVLTLLSPLIVPAVFLAGYLLRVVRAGIDDEAEPPAFTDWERLLREGVAAFVIVLVYQFLPLFVAVVTVGTAVLTLLSGADVGPAVGLAGVAAGLSLSALLALAFGYVAPVGLANYAREGQVGAAFDLGVIRTVAFDGGYAVAWLAGVALLLAANAVAVVLGFVPVVGAFVGFYAWVAAAWAWGRGYADATEAVDASTDREASEA
jgi:hypothetical protein